MTSVADIRATFLNYFERQGHTQVASSSLVPRNDPTLMFANSGMVQFKNVFTGAEARPYKRATTAQKCVRAGGKHNDLENVGYTARHHTFFEMLGNFSFGDYFKEQAISYAWELITKEYALPKDKLLVTVYAEDKEATDYWKKIAGLRDDKIIRIATADNFWSMGDTGPCGPCSEIFFDHGDKISGGPPGSPDEDGDRFIEIWNLVFMQFEQQASGTRTSLPRPSIDTGMGLERISAILQGVHDNYDIDLMRALIEASAHFSNTDADGPFKTSHRVIADHLRSSCFLIADGVLPSNEGRGYVLRRIMRRAMRHAHLLGCREPLLAKLVPALVQTMGAAYPELVQSQALITETLYLEETRFKLTLERGLKLLDEETAGLSAGGLLQGDTAFKLYDTFGFPIDLTRDILKSRQISVDEAGFETAMARQRAEARKAWAGSGETADDKIWFELDGKFGATEFLGYDTEQAEGEIRAIISNGAEAAEAETGSRVFIITNQTPFYAESGGQVGDTGIIKSVTATARVIDTKKKLGKLFLHEAIVEQGTLKVGDQVEMSVDHARRNAIRGHHSATHLLHEALRQQLGTHVAQKGSLVAPDRLRFDISHPKALRADEITTAEQAVNARIQNSSDVTTGLMTPEAAVEMGAMALFGEKYGDEVRVISMGGRDAAAVKDYSVELCGGTHVKRTGDIGTFKILSDSAVSAGVRRIEAVTGQAALDYFAAQGDLLEQTATLLKATTNDVPKRVSALLDDRKNLEKEIVKLRQQLLSGSAASHDDVKIINGVKFMGRVLDGVPAKDLKPMADQLKKNLGSGIVALIAVDDGKASVVVGVTNDLTARYSAVDLVKTAAVALGGQGGGGRADMAQAGGPNGQDAAQAISQLEALLSRGV